LPNTVIAAFKLLGIDYGMTKTQYQPGSSKKLKAFRRQ